MIVAVPDDLNLPKSFGVDLQNLRLIVRPAQAGAPAGIVVPAGFQSVNTTSAAAAEAGILTVVESLTVSWSRPTGRDHQEPASWTVEFLGTLAAGRVLTFDAEMIVYADINVPDRNRNETNTPLAAGYLRDMRRQRTNDPNIWRWTVTAASVLERAAAVRLADKPWRSELAPVRWLRLVPLASKAGVLLAPFGDAWVTTNVTLAARDVDNFPLLDAVRRAVAPALMVVVENVSGGRPAVDSQKQGGGAGIDRLLDGSVRFQFELPKSTRRAYLPALPAGAVESLPRELARGSLVTQVDVLWKVPGTIDTPNPSGEEKITSYKSETSLAPAIWRMETDSNGDFDPELVEWCQEVVTNAARPTWTLAGSPRLVTSKVPTGTLQYLISAYSRATSAVVITDGPDDLGSNFVVIGGTLEIRAGKIKHLAVTLEPGTLSGVRGLVWSDFNEAQEWQRVGDNPHPPRFTELNGYNGEGWVLTFDVAGSFRAP